MIPYGYQSISEDDVIAVTNALRKEYLTTGPLVIEFEKEIEIEIRDTIVNLMKQNILIEVWDWDQWSLNNLVGFNLLDIFDIIKI